MTERELIHRYFYRQPHSTSVITTIGDDAAIVEVPRDMQLVMTMDTLNAGIHFLSEQTPAADIGYKAAAVNLSDLAAMGAEPKWVTLSLSLPKLDEAWLAEFSQGFFAALDPHSVALIGGDINRGPLSITVQAEGFVPRSKALLRSGAKPGDIIYVSGQLGGAAFALSQLQSEKLPTTINTNYLTALHRPRAQIELGLALRDIASSCIDLSDGLARDLTNITTASRVGACVNVNKLPMIDWQLVTIAKSDAIKFALCGGDDYQLCFTASPEKNLAIEQLQSKGFAITPIGVITENSEIDWQGLPFDAGQLRGFEHFISTTNF